MLKKERGFLLISLYMLMPLLLIMGGVMVSYAWSDIRAGLRTQASTQAFYFAEAGLDNAIVQLRNTGSVANTTVSTGSGSGSGGDSQNNSTSVTSTSVGDYGNYSVAVADLGNNRLRLTSTGTSNYLSGPMTKSLESIVQVTPSSSPLFEKGIFGETSLTMSGHTKTDSFNSSNGPYSQNPAGANGDVSTNGTISLSDYAVVNGDALVAPMADPETHVTATESTQISGTVAAAEKKTKLKAVTPPSNIISKGALTLSGNTTLMLSAGTYVYDSIRISGNAQLKFSGPTTLYVSSIKMSGHAVFTALNLPTNLLVYVTGSLVSASGNAQFYGGIYAPAAAVTLSGNALVYGGIMANTVTMKDNGTTHYDEKITDIVSSEGDGTSVVKILSWGEPAEMSPTGSMMSTGSISSSI